MNPQKSNYINTLQRSLLKIWGDGRNPGNVQRLEVYLRALRSTGILVVLGRFQEVSKKCHECHQFYKTHEEKKTDVNIAIRIFQLAYENQYDKAYIISGDSDLLPAIRAVQQCFPQKEFGVVVPVGQRAKALQKACNTSFKLRLDHCLRFRFPDPIHTTDNRAIHCPPSWR
ncbi:MAG TPA: NYN domain-containing protein [Candidatus Aminicenantes bacterium]|nr:NYN domain-containing protein [Candidatus Aminicenantes bacterium]